MSEPAAVEVLDAGFLTTVQDAGRPGFAALGVPLAGAADPDSLAIANAVVGNEPGAAALECTLLGPEVVAVRDVIVGLSGADLAATVRPSGRDLVPGTAVRLAAGEHLSLPGPPRAGLRAYLALAGGIDVPVVLGSRSTSLVGGFGGGDGRALRVGDRIVTGPAGRAAPRAGRRWPLESGAGEAPVRVVAGPAAGTPAGRAALEQLVAAPWTVDAASDRRGLRLGGVPLGLDLDADGPSHGVVVGTIQVTPSGRPLVLMPDAGTTGGYPVLAIAITADRGRLGQAAPGSTIRLRLVDLATARRAEIERRARLDAGRARLALAEPWDDLASDAGA